MLSIVKLDLDTDDAEDGDMDTQEHYSMADGNSNVMDSLALVPVVYTTRLDDMAVFSHSAGLHPSEITARILDESKPMLFDYPSDADDRTRSRKNAFRSLKTKLNTIYKRNNNLPETIDLKTDIDSIPFEECVIKREEPEESNDTCKYRELLKLCRPVSVVLTKMIEFPTVKDPLEENEIQNETVTVISSSDTDDDEPLVNKIPTKSYSKKVNTNKPDQPTLAVKFINEKPNNSNTTAPSNDATDCQQAFLNFTGNRLLLNGLMEMHDFYSQEFHSYITDSEGLLIDYYTDHLNNISKYKSIENHAKTRLTFLNCCWVQRDQYIRSMYPKVLMYTNFRFMRKQHTCPLGKCKCCCRNKKEFIKPNLHVSNSDESASAPLPYNEEDLEIQALEDEITRSINSMNKKAPRLDTEWIRTYLNTPDSINPPSRRTSLISKALLYKQRVPKKKRDNRQLVTIKNLSIRFHVLTFRNFASNLKEIYEVDSYGELLSYMKVPCFTNTTRPDIKKLTSDSESVRDVCCWFKRQLFIMQLLLDKVVTHSAAKFLRSRHTCSTDACSCCCQPKPNKFGKLQLCDIKISSQLASWQAIQENKSGTIPPSNTIAAQEPPKSKSQAIPETVKLGAITSSNTVAKQASSKKKRSLVAEKRVPIGPDFWRSYSRIAPRPTLSANDVNDKTTNTPAMPVLRPLLAKPTPAKENPLPPEQIRHIANVLQGEEMSGEVNTLIMSILERFKDVRLTISHDGKVQAALNMPVHTLSTVELKVLANILSYAQSQINLLGLNSGMSLSSVINMKNNNTNKNSETTVPSVSTPPSSYVSLLDEASTKEAYEYFTKTLAVKNNAFKGPFSSFLAKKLNVPDSQKLQNEMVAPVIENETVMEPVIENEMVTPVIQNVFSLKKENIDETNDKSSDNSGSVMKVFTYTNKRAQEDTSSGAPKRIKVASSSSLASPNTMEPTAHVVYKSAPLLNPGSLEVGNLVPGVPLLSNPNFQLVVNPKAQLLGMNTLVIPSSNPPMVQVPAGPSKERTLVINPLPPYNTHAPLPTVAVVNSNASQGLGVPGTANAAELAAAPVVSETMPMPIKSESSSDIIVVKSEDDDCILGM